MSGRPDPERLPAPDIDAALLDADGRVAEDVPCVRCRYNLRTLPWDGRCPECNHPVIESIRPADLRFSPTQWVERLDRGSRKLVLSVLAWGATQAWAFCVGDLTLGVTVFAGVTLLLGAIGIVQVTSPDPRARRERRTSARRIARYALLAFVLLVPAAVGTVGQRSVHAGAAVAALVILLSTVLPIAVLLTLRDLAQRAAAERVARRIDSTIEVHVLGACLLVLLSVMVFSGHPLLAVFAVLVCMLLLVVDAIAACFWIAILLQLGKALRTIGARSESPAAGDTADNIDAGHSPVTRAARPPPAAVDESDSAHTAEVSEP